MQTVSEHAAAGARHRWACRPRVRAPRDRTILPREPDRLAGCHERCALRFPDRLRPARRLLPPPAAAADHSAALARRPRARPRTVQDRPVHQRRPARREGGAALSPAPAAPARAPARPGHCAGKRAPDPHARSQNRVCHPAPLRASRCSRGFCPDPAGQRRGAIDSSRPPGTVPRARVARARRWQRGQRAACGAHDRALRQR